MQLELIIRVDDHGHVSVSGAIDNQLTCYGLLECAKQTIADYHREKAQRIVQPANAIAEALRLVK